MDKPEPLTYFKRRPLRICILSYSIYDMDLRVKRYAKSLNDSGYFVDVLALKRNGLAKKETIDHIHIQRIMDRKYNEKGLFSYALNMIRFFLKATFLITFKHLRYRYSLIHVNNPPDFLIFSTVLPKLFGAKIIMDMHENIPELFSAKFDNRNGKLILKLLLLLERMATRYADFVLAAHDLLKNRLIKRDQLSEDRCLSLLNYPQLDNFEPIPHKSDDPELKILYPGTISYHHGIDILVNAIALVKEKGFPVRLEIYATSTNQKYLDEIHHLITKLDLRREIIFNDPVPANKIGTIMAQADMGIVPKRGGEFGSEAFSTKILEFMAAGIPVIASRTAIEEYYFNEALLQFFEPENPINLAESIMLLINNQDRRKALVLNGLKFVSENNWERKKIKYLNTIETLLISQKKRKER